MSYNGLTLIDERGKEYKLIFAPKETEIRLPWDTAIKFCRALRIGGFSDWYLGTKIELLWRMDECLSNAYYWTSTEVDTRQNFDKAWVIRSCSGFNISTSFGPKTALANVRACRRDYF